MIPSSSPERSAEPGILRIIPPLPEDLNIQERRTCKLGISTHLFSSKVCYALSIHTRKGVNYGVHHYRYLSRRCVGPDSDLSAVLLAHLCKVSALCSTDRRNLYAPLRMGCLDVWRPIWLIGRFSRR